ncbi:MAG TPA: hypothetical protein VFZ96_07495 [Actinomycetota bacterium]|nr:hypothetical protein [Actinomycetota bacterium]
MIHDMVATELVKARAAALQAEAVGDGRVRRHRVPRRPRGGLRLAVGVRLVSAGHRLLGDAVEVG